MPVSDRPPPALRRRSGWIALVAPLLLSLLEGCDDPADARPPERAGGEPILPAAAGAPPSDVGASSTGGPGAFEVARDRAFALRAANEEPHALRDALLEAHALSPEAYGINRLLGETYLALDEPELALHHERLALSARPDDVDAASAALELLVRLGRPAEAEELLPRLLADEASAGSALAAQAALLDARGQRELALSALRRAEELPLARSVAARLLLGQFLMQDGDFAGARARFEAALSVVPDSVEAVKGVADACHRSGLPDEARHWDEVLGLLRVLGDDEYVGKKLEEQRRALERLAVIHPAWAEGLPRLAGVLRRLGEHEQACAAIERYLREHAAEVDEAEGVRLRERYCG